MMQRPTADMIQQLFEQLPDKLKHNIDRSGPPHTTLQTACWQWTARTNRNGYGRVCVDGKEPVVHRYVWQYLLHTLPGSLLLDHLCRNRRCCNPHHLEPVTNQVNTLRGKAVLFSKA